eukprot:2425415-Pleurochrysis_carterae.AAC.5
MSTTLTLPHARTHAQAEAQHNGTRGPLASNGFARTHTLLRTQTYAQLITTARALSRSLPLARTHTHHAH